jgi:hypothetical protein
MLRSNYSKHKVSTRMISSSFLARRLEFDRTGAPSGPGADCDEQRGSDRESVTSNQERKILTKAKYVLKQLPLNPLAPLALAGPLPEIVAKTLVWSRAFVTRTLTINN